MQAGYPLLGPRWRRMTIADYPAAPGMMTDLFRRRDKLMEAMDKFVPFLLRQR
jgi:hypothetical protein